MNFNEVRLAGHITRDVEVRHTPSNVAVGSFGVAINRKWQSKNGEWQEEVTFVDCEAWGRTAEVMGQYLHKGSPVFIEGRLKLDQWQDKDGGNRSKVKVVVERFHFIGGKSGGDEDRPEPRRDERPEILSKDVPF